MSAPTVTRTKSQPPATPTRPKGGSSPREPGGNPIALLVAAIALSVAASMFAVNIGGNSANEPGAALTGDETVTATGTGGETGSTAGTATTTAPAAAPATAPPIFHDPTDIPPPVGARAATTVSVELTTTEVVGQLADGTTYDYWTFDGTVPGPMIRVREGDTVELTLSNGTDSVNIHSIDMHAVNGPGGGAKATQVPPGESRSVIFEAQNPGVYIYHCASPHIPSHIANGMFGLIVVEPEGGFAPVDREFYLVQSEIYTAEERGTQGLVTYDADKMMAEDPTYVVFNGQVAGLTGDNAMQAEVGETVRLFVGDAGPNLVSSFHVIGEIFDNAHVEGGSLVNHNVQTTVIPAGGATWVEFTIDQPGDYIALDHAITRAIDGGGLAIIHAEGTGDPARFREPEGQREAREAAAAAETAESGGDGVLEIAMTEFAFNMPSEATAGTHTLRITNNGQAPHQFTLRPQGAEEFLVDTGMVDAGDTVEVEVTLDPGTYEIGCHIPGHFEAGMKGALDITS